MSKAKKKPQNAPLPPDTSNGLLGVLKEMVSSKPETSEFWGVLDRLNKSDEDLLLKTDLPKPRPVAGLLLVAKYHEDLGFKKTAGYLRTYLTRYMEARISKNAQGREGTLRVLESVGKKEEIDPSLEEVY